MRARTVRRAVDAVHGTQRVDAQTLFQVQPEQRLVARAGGVEGGDDRVVHLGRVALLEVLQLRIEPHQEALVRERLGALAATALAAALGGERGRRGGRDPAAQRPLPLVVGELRATPRAGVSDQDLLGQHLAHVGGQIVLAAAAADDAHHQRLVVVQKARHGRGRALNTRPGQPQVCRMPDRRQLSVGCALGEVTDKIFRGEAEVGPRRARCLNICSECDV